MNMILNDVTLSKTDTCLTFVLKRLGQPKDLCTYITFHEHFYQYPFVRYKDKLEVGDLLMWDKDIKWEYMAVSIKNNTIIWENVPKGFHFGIYEGNGVVIIEKNDKSKISYSEEEVIELLTQRSKHFGTNVKPFNELLLKQDLEWFEENKKKRL